MVMYLHACLPICILTYDIGNVSRATGDVENLGVLVDVEGEKLFDQGLRVPVAHNRLALVEVLQVLDRKLCLGRNGIKINFSTICSIQFCLRSGSCTVGQLLKSLVLYSVLVVDPNMYIIIKFWMLYCLPPGPSSWSM